MDDLRSPTAGHGRLPSPAAELLVTTNPAPVVVGTGLVALDVVYGPDAPHDPSVMAGGTCGNVMMGLSFLGWNAFPVARLAADGAGDSVRTDLSRWGVHLDTVSLAPTTGTPVIVQRIIRDARGETSHKFSLSCQECGRWLPTYAPVPAAVVPEAVTRLPEPDACFIDRASPGAIALAEWARAMGALVYVEPSGRSTPTHLARLLSLAHVIKYSADHRALVDTAKQVAGKAYDPWLEVETRGAAGLRYRSRSGPGWQSSAAVPVPNVRDTAGAGDWCSIGILHLVGQGGAASAEHLPNDLIREAICVGQALSAWTCQFEGARGGMASTSRPALARIVAGVLRHAPAWGAVKESAPSAHTSGHLALCRDCTDSTAV